MQSPYDCTHVLCRCGGVLLLTDDSRIQVLWNPSTRTQKRIWVPFQRAGSRYGLCPDPATDDFKVVVVNEDDDSVYSVKSKSLIIKRKKFDGLYADYGRSIRDYTQVCVDGAVYWVCSRGNVDKIIYYDPRDDKFKVLQKPECVKDDAGKRIFLADLGGSLCLRCRGQDETTIRIWIKEKGIDNNSWKDLVTIENVKMGIWSFEPQCIVGNKIVIQDRFHMDLVVYSPLEKTFEQFGYTACRSGLVPYLASPVITKRKSKRKRL